MKTSNFSSRKLATSSKTRTQNRSRPSKSRYSNSSKLSNNASKNTRRDAHVKWIADTIKNGGSISIHSPNTTQPSPRKPKNPNYCPYDWGFDYASKVSKTTQVKTNTFTLFDFSQALLSLKRGLKVSRVAWLADGDSSSTTSFLSIPPPSNKDTDSSYFTYLFHSKSPSSTPSSPTTHPTQPLVEPYIALTHNSKLYLGWTPSSQDLFAVDYFIV